MTGKSHSGGALLHVRVSPNARKSEVLGFKGDILQVRVAAPPVEGKANRELIDCLSQVLDLSPSYLNIVGGRTSRNKVVTIGGLSYEDIIKRLSA